MARMYNVNGQIPRGESMQVLLYHHNELPKSKQEHKGSTMRIEKWTWKYKQVDLKHKNVDFIINK